MREIIQESADWNQNGKPVALATVVKTWGSAPRKVGAKMAISGEGAMAGSVSGGCVEGAVVEAGLETLGNGAAQLLAFGVADETAWTVGLACGGMIDVFVEPFVPDMQAIVANWIAGELAGVVVSVLSGEFIGRKLLYSNDTVQFSSLPAELEAAATQFAKDALAGRKSVRATLEEVELFADVIMPSPTLIMVGGVHIAQALVPIAEVVGFRPIIIDPRRAFGSTERFENVTLHQAWPRKVFPDLVINEATAVALLTHDPKIDDQALEFVLPSRAFYIGALGSKKTAAKRVKRLEEGGFSAEQINRIHGPVGLNINAKTPEEIALAIMGQIIQVWRA